MSFVEIEALSAPATLDVREVAPRDRHPLIFGTFERITPGHSFELLNDHDPRPLYYLFQAEQPGQVEWTYLEQGPEVWRVRIGRVQDLASTPILELLASHPELQPILEEFGLDTCCGGHFSVAEAAAHDGIDVQPLVQALEQALAPRSARG
jgi:uncharacterized protein (DUF2249 family)